MNSKNLVYLKKYNHKVYLKKFKTNYIVTKKYLKWLKDKNITKFTKIKSNNNKKSIKRYIRDNSNNNSYFLKILVKNKVFFSHIGNLKITIEKEAASIALIIGERKFHNSGIGTNVIKEALKFLKKKKFLKSMLSLIKKILLVLKRFKKTILLRFLEKNLNILINNID